MGNTRSCADGLSPAAEGEYGPTLFATLGGSGTLPGFELSPLSPAAKSVVSVAASDTDNGSWSFGWGAGEAWPASP